MGAYAHYALHKLKILPSQFLEMSMEERAFIIASIRIKVKNEEKAIKDAKRKG